MYFRARRNQSRAFEKFPKSHEKQRGESNVQKQLPQFTPESRHDSAIHQPSVQDGIKHEGGMQKMQVNSLFNGFEEPPLI